MFRKVMPAWLFMCASYGAEEFQSYLLKNQLNLLFVNNSRGGNLNVNIWLGPVV